MKNQRNKKPANNEPVWQKLAFKPGPICMYYKLVRSEAASLPSLKLRGIVVPAFLRYIIGF